MATEESFAVLYLLGDYDMNSGKIVPKLEQNQAVVAAKYELEGNMLAAD